MTAAGPDGIPTETPDQHGAYPRLTPEQLDALAQYGEYRPARRGEVLFREGEPCEEFLAIVSGMVEVIHDYGGPDQRTVAVHGPGRFLGELGLLEGQTAFDTAVVRKPGQVLAVPVERQRALVARDPALGDLILRAYLGRRSLLIGLGAGFRILGSCYSPNTLRLREFAARNRLPHRWIDLEKDKEAEALLRRFGIRPDETPVVMWKGEQILRNPSIADLARLIGLPTSAHGDGEFDLVVIGAGPAGLAAAVYGSSDGLVTVAVDAMATGGQAATSSRIENYLGFPSGISGGELMERSVLQARKFGAQLTVPAEATSLEPRDGRYTLTFADGSEIRAATIVLASGVRYRRLDVPGIDRLEGSSVYYAATLHEANLCRMDPVAVVGGGNSAGQAVLFLAEYAPKVYLIVRSGDLGKDMSRYLVDQVTRHPKVEVLTHTEVRQVNGEGALQSLTVEDNASGDRRELPAHALFVFIGARPHTEWLKDVVALDRPGFVLTGADARAVADENIWESLGRGPLMLETTMPGVFAAGDVRSGSVKRVASAAGEGAIAVRLVHEHRAQEGNLVRGSGVSEPRSVPGQSVS
ncbi:FAD-dependent oxidoreductase [Streptomyces decoyicus]|uniref:FAD-dependent oxidoreductase n=1 Tax=Streptomyces decoyicus TaxID=249567 RepID=UPI0004AB56FB|nr:cyclic nucleotide-binding domain-containing thioredoxin-disulfide reductase [Streptomyces decoyicus]QZY13868.1 FAD-dependent oxidoreductase [Streptomyces decoyicus]